MTDAAPREEGWQMRQTMLCSMLDQIQQQYLYWKCGESEQDFIDNFLTPLLDDPATNGNDYAAQVQQSNVDDQNLKLKILKAACAYYINAQTQHDKGNGDTSWMLLNNSFYWFGTANAINMIVGVQDEALSQRGKAAVKAKEENVVPLRDLAREMALKGIREGQYKNKRQASFDIADKIADEARQRKIRLMPNGKPPTQRTLENVWLLDVHFPS